MMIALAAVAHATCFGGAFVGKPAPMFSAEAVTNGAFGNISLSDYRGTESKIVFHYADRCKGKYFVLFFYPLDFTFVCPTEIMAFNDQLKAFRDIDCEVAAVSVDSKYSHLAWWNTPRSEGGLGKAVQLPLIADITKDIARSYGVLLEQDGVALRCATVSFVVCFLLDFISSCCSCSFFIQLCTFSWSVTVSVTYSYILIVLQFEV